MSQGIEMAASVTTKASYVGSGGLVLFGFLNIHELGIICGIMLGIVTLVLNFYFKHKDDRRKDQADKRLAAIQEQSLKNTKKNSEFGSETTTVLLNKEEVCGINLKSL